MFGMMSVANDMSGIVAHNLSGLGWSPLEVTGGGSLTHRGNIFLTLNLR
jgi:hypothetical protein